MALNHDLVHEAFGGRKDPSSLAILSDHADEQGHPELADAFRNEGKSVNPWPWYDENYGVDPEERTGSAQRYMRGEDPFDEWVSPRDHLKRIRDKGLQLAPGIYARHGYDGFGRSGAQEQGFHVYDLRGLDTEFNPDKKEYKYGHEVPDEETFGSRAEYDAALEEYFAGRGAPRFFKYKGAHQVKLARASVIAEALSKQQRYRRAIAVKIAREARLRLESILDARSNNTAGVLQTYGHENDPKGVEYAAAWYGYLTQPRSVTTFHVHDGGPDMFHTWTTPMKPDDVLRVSGNLPAVVTSDGRVSLFDPGNKNATQIARLKEATYANSPRAERGTAATMAGREAYRSKIKEYQGGE